MARTGLAIGGVVLIAGTLVAWAVSSDAGSITPLGAVTGIRLAGGSGNIEIRRGAHAEVAERLGRWFGGGVGDPIHRVEDGSLVLDTDCGWSCGVDYVVTLPAPVAVEGQLDSANLTIMGMAAVDTRATSGSITLRDIENGARARTESGDIEATGVGGDVDFGTASGSVTGTRVVGREIRMRSDSGDVSVEMANPVTAILETSSGDVRATVPRGVYRVDAETDSGDDDVGVRQDRNAARGLTVRTDSGDILVNPA